MAVTEQQVIEVYLATFNRAADKAGLDYWVNDSGLTIDQIAKSFFDQAETKALYPDGTSNTDFVNKIYDNLFGREADKAGLDYWVNELNNGKPKSVMIEMVKNGATGDDKKLIENKAKVAQKFVDNRLSNTDQAKDILKNVTSDEATATTAINTLKSSISDFDLGALENAGTADGFTLFEPTIADGIKNIKIPLDKAIDTYKLIDIKDALAFGDDIKTAVKGNASINEKGLAHFDRGDNDSLKDQITAIEKAMQSGTAKAGQFAFFESVDSNDSYVFISDGVDGLSETDKVIKLTGITDLSDSAIYDGTIILS